MVSLGRRLLLRLSAVSLSLIVWAPHASGRNPDDDIVVVRGWVLKRSDLRKLGW